MLTLETVGKRIRDLRESKNMNQQQLADSLVEYGLNMSRETLSKIETGNRSISVVEIKAISSILGTNTEELLKGEEEETLVTLFRRVENSNTAISEAEIEQIHELIKGFIFQKGIYDGTIAIKKRMPIWKR